MEFFRAKSDGSVSSKKHFLIIGILLKIKTNAVLYEQGIERNFNMIALMSFVSAVFLFVANVYAQTTPPPSSQSAAEQMMMQYDFNQDGKVTEKEFVIGNGETGYRTHISNIYNSLNLQKTGSLTKQQYWFIEAADDAKYKKDLVAYFEYLDSDADGYISSEDYKNTFTGDYIAEFGPKYVQAIDSDKDNKISKDEYMNFDFTSLPSSSREQFHNIDTNNDNVITYEEFESVFKSLQ